jgi:hypothetical protein
LPADLNLVSWTARQQAAPTKSAILASIIGARGGLINYLRRANAALSDNSIQTPA